MLPGILTYQQARFSFYMKNKYVAALDVQNGLMWGFILLWSYQKKTFSHFHFLFFQAGTGAEAFWKQCLWIFCLCVRVSVWDHAAVEGATLLHLCHGSGGVPVFRWSRVRMGFTCFCPEDGGVLQLSVRQHNRSQCNSGLRSVWSPHLHCFWVPVYFYAAKSLTSPF